MALDIFLADEAATIRFGEDMALAAKRGDYIALSGDLGAGKSTFSRALIRAVADDPYLEVPSPTFTLVQSYDLRIPVAHFDLYRIAEAAEIDELGFDEALSDGICLVEWPEKGFGALPTDGIVLTFTHEGDGRRVAIEGPAPAMSRIRRSLAIRAFLDDAGYRNATRRHLTGDASVRAYEHVYSGDRRFVLMDAPRHTPGPILAQGKYYQQIAHIAEDVNPFIAVGKHLVSRGLRAPEIYETNIEQGILLIEDLGSDGVLDGNGVPIAERYRESAACLVRLHGQPLANDLPVTDDIVYRVPDFDRDAMQIEVSLLTDWYLPWKRGTPASDEERSAYVAIWDGLIGSLSAAEHNLLLRDFHSPNIIWRPDATGTDRVGIIDFQDAMIGPSAYDVASLVQDARVDMPDGVADGVLGHYLSLRANHAGFDRERFMRDWHVMAAQRNCKLVGIWVRLMQRDGKPAYMRHMPRTLRNLTHALSHPDLAPLREWCEKAGILATES
ncbi:tRNA (adenosine(37)-N6)-threonylcarbamoyltransferase complex ATPase subunit type 1 TsaE [Shinella sp. CPCC 101442]|uniref:tRNA (adenosine(37)-N6)-threonylcarbamoyltransferase complex ATPase subunit type 1 TsaE n=1 Tax=Shinella sp. CPCC 101442 TaxID=2932265 RepID=UPI002152260D|nr:tRNA (adenosine(37)-N6)-threonylcarbamoyltransferase complex ATPase subunit type 1 TsaE [Shinella sp. CPCC 101442]MCR6502979.1 tRNA (adenosine(37)-N6)-threonylcarbamoyltransferase complex ATPase subunit type 1 TsaE [Shinella sp. CPCC 101442]